MKRRLGLVGQPSSTRWAPARVLRLGAEIVSVTDTGDGSAARRFAALLCEAGASPTDPEHHALPVNLRIVVRAPLPSPQARARAEVLEEGADVVLGSVRPAFASLLAAACAPGATS